MHPPFWPEDLDYTGKRVAIIGSGATVVTLLPSLTEQAAHVVQLQRLPTYIISRPSEDRYTNWMHRWLPDRLAYALSRWWIIPGGQMRRKKMVANIKAAKMFFIVGLAQELGDRVDWKKHFVPSCWPGQQRTCAVPDGDMFRILREGRALCRGWAGEAELAEKNTAIKFISRHFLRSAHLLPAHGKAFPWLHEQDYMRDRKTPKRGRVDDGSREFLGGTPVDLPAEQRAGVAAQ